MIRNKRTKKIKIAINKITLKKSLMYNKDEKNLIYGAFPSSRIRTTPVMHKAKCRSTSANIQKVNIM